MSNKIDMMGEEVGRLKVIGEAEERISGYIGWICKCKCGKKVTIRSSCLRDGTNRSCGCLNRETSTKHGKSDHPLYKKWANIKGRCYNPNNTNYHRYGGRGIKMASVWKQDFQNFYDDLIGIYKSFLKEHENKKPFIDRIDNSGNYEPGNVQFVTFRESCNNTRNNRIIEWNDQRNTLAQWSRKMGIKSSTLRSRLDAGWETEKAMTKPVR